MVEARNIVISRRFRGPPDSGNGGYSCGLLAVALNGGSQAAVRLSAPPPLDTELTIRATADGIECRHGDTLIATAREAQVALDVPPPPSIEIAQAAEAHYAGFDHHWLPGCFVCGPERDAGDALRIFPGEVGRRPRTVAARWTPQMDLTDAEGVVRPEFLWAALDCPGYFSIPDGPPALLGQLAAKIVAPVPADKPCIVTGWQIAVEGRKHRTGTAIHAADGTLQAVGDAIWVTIPASDSA